MIVGAGIARPYRNDYGFAGSYAGRVRRAAGRSMIAPTYSIVRYPLNSSFPNWRGSAQGSLV